MCDVFEFTTLYAFNGNKFMLKLNQNLAKIFHIAIPKYIQGTMESIDHNSSVVYACILYVQDIIFSGCLFLPTGSRCV